MSLLKTERMHSSPNDITGEIIVQYTGCTGLLEELYKIAPDQCWHEDGVGCCDITKEESEFDLAGIAYKRLKDMRELMRIESAPESDALCPYHEKGHGCVLGAYKSPLCASAYCKGMLEGRVDFSYVRNRLKKILEGGYDSEENVLRPEANDNLVKGFRDYIGGILDRLDRQPLSLKTLSAPEKSLS
ncbi:MAG: hypothetical protein ABIG84_06865 [archaeon]